MNLHVGIRATGEYVPSLRVTSDSLDERWGKLTGWTSRHSGIEARHFAAAHETSSVMAAQAARRAITQAGMQLGDIDCIVSACSVMEQPIP